MKSINQRIFEEVLGPMFPGKGSYGGRWGTDDEVTFNHDEDGDHSHFNFSNNMYDAFWLAEKVGLFTHNERWEGKGSLTTFNGDYCIDFISTSSKMYVVNFYLGKTIPEVICKAILGIYGVNK